MSRLIHMVAPLLLALTLWGCIDVGAEVDKRKDVTTGAVSNELPEDSRPRPDLVFDILDGSADRRDGQSDLPGENLDSFEVAADLAEEIDAQDQDSIDSDVCEPQCDGLECGPDMCGGLCGFCPGDEICTLGKCKNCKPDCDFKECGPDGCGSQCGVCPSKFSCFSNTCVAPTCTESVVIYEERFNNCDQGDFGIFDGQPDDGVTWYAGPLEYGSPPCSLYLGDPLKQHYDTGGTVTVELLSSTVVLPAESALQLTFGLNMLTESLPSPLYPYDYDVLFLFFEVDGEVPSQIWSSKSVLNDTQGEMVTIAVDISDLAGLTGRFRFRFDTIDSTDNDNPGIFIDDVVVASICPYCKSDDDCLDDDECTEETCVLFSNVPEVGTCTVTPIPDCPPEEEEPDEGS